MTTRPVRMAAALACTVALALPSRAAADPGGLNERAEEHIVKAIGYFNNKAYANAEAEFMRAKFFAPDWRPLHFNLAVVSEAQGKLGTALREYNAFKPLATPDEGLLVDQRIFELGQRRKNIAAVYKQQIGIGAGAATLGIAGVGVGAALVALSFQAKGKAEDAQNELDGLDQTDPNYTLQSTALSSDIEAYNSKKSKFLYGGYIAIIAGVIIAAYAAIPLSRAIKSKRELDGLALGPTRLKWNGGAGVVLRF
jgi:hypothetical protein